MQAYTNNKATIVYSGSSKTIPENAMFGCTMPKKYLLQQTVGVTTNNKFFISSNLLN